MFFFVWYLYNCCKTTYIKVVIFICTIWWAGLDFGTARVVKTIQRDCFCLLRKVAPDHLSHRPLLFESNLLSIKKTMAFLNTISFFGGQGWIRTNVDSRRQIYSLVPLTTRPPTRITTNDYYNS